MKFTEEQKQKIKNNIKGLYALSGTEWTEQIEPIVDTAINECENLLEGI